MSTVPVVERLVALREQAGLTQVEVAQRMGTSQPVIARLEAGRRDPRLSTVERYARIVGAAVEIRRSTKEAGGSAARLDDLHRLTDADLAAAIQEEPLSTGDRRWDAGVAGAVDWAASSRGIPSPRW